MFFLPQGAKNQSTSSKETKPIQKFDPKKKKKVIPTPMMKIPTKSTKLSKIQSKDPKQWKYFNITLEMLMEWNPIQIDWVLM